MFIFIDINIYPIHINICPININICPINIKLICEVQTYVRYKSKYSISYTQSPQAQVRT